MDARFALLTLDGGGARGYLTAKILEHVEAHLDLVTGEPAPLGTRFDLIAGTSTGGIIALALAVGIPASDVAALYEEQLPRIFAPAMRRGPWAGYIRPRYRADALRSALQAFFGDRLLGDARTDVCVTAVSLVNSQPRLFRSSYAGQDLLYRDERMVDVALATSAAPAVFAAHSTRHLSDLVDGGLCANNPVLVAVAEAFSFRRDSLRGVPAPHDLGDRCLDRLALLSVGTGEQCAMPYEPASLREAGALGWGLRFHHVASESQAQLADMLARRLLGHAYRRLNPRLEFPMALDDSRRMGELRNLAQLSEDDQSFLDDRVAARVPARSARTADPTGPATATADALLAHGTAAPASSNSE